MEGGFEKQEVSWEAARDPGIYRNILLQLLDMAVEKREDSLKPIILQMEIPVEYNLPQISHLMIYVV